MKKMFLLVMVVFFSFPIFASAGEVIKSQGYPFYGLLLTLVIMLIVDALNMVEKWNYSSAPGKERVSGFFVFFCFCLTTLFGMDLNYSLVPTFIEFLTTILIFFVVIITGCGVFGYERRWRRVLRMTLYSLTLLVLLSYFFIG